MAFSLLTQVQQEYEPVDVICSLSTCGWATTSTLPTNRTTGQSCEIAGPIVDELRQHHQDSKEGTTFEHGHRDYTVRFQSGKEATITCDSYYATYYEKPSFFEGVFHRRKEG